MKDPARNLISEICKLFDKKNVLFWLKICPCQKKSVILHYKMCLHVLYNRLSNSQKPK